MGRLLIQFPGTTTAKALTETLSKNVIIVDEDLHQLRLHDGSTAGGHLIGGSSGSGVPVGTIIPFAGNSVPQGYLLCDGSAISRTTYASLFAVIGTIYGTGDGNSTFNLPNYTNGKFLLGAYPNTWSRQDASLNTGLIGNLCFYNTDGSKWTGYRFIGSNSGDLIDMGASSSSKGSSKRISLYTDLSPITKDARYVIKY